MPLPPDSAPHSIIPARIKKGQPLRPPLFGSVRRCGWAIARGAGSRITRLENREGSPMTDIAADAVPAPDPAIAAEAAVPRIATLDIVRGVAIMGILAMNIVAFSMPFQAYMNPTAYGLESNADLASWVFSFIFVDGKMRGLFSFLFGASTLLVIERAEAAGESPVRVHYMRMIWLLVFGLIHFYFIWFGDILALYAQTGLILFFFRKLSARALVRWGVGLVLVQTLLFAAVAAWAQYLSAAASLPPDQAATWREMQEGFVPLTGRALVREIALYQGPYAGLVHERLIEHLRKPFTGTPLFLAETLGYMVLGMAALKSGFFRGDWPALRYRKWALAWLRGAGRRRGGGGRARWD